MRMETFQPAPTHNHNHIHILLRKTSRTNVLQIIYAKINGKPISVNLRAKLFHELVDLLINQLLDLLGELLSLGHHAF